MKIHKTKVVLLKLFLLFFILQSCGQEKDFLNKKSILEISDENKEMVFLAGLSTTDIAIKTDAEQLEISNSTNWCSVAFFPSSKKLQVEVTENLSLAPREAFLSIEYKGVRETIKVVQFGVHPAIIISEDTIVTDFKQKTISVDLYSNVTLSASSNVDWLTNATKEKSVSLDPVKYTFNFNISSLKDTDVREGHIRFKQTEGDLTDTIVIKQQLVSSNNYLPEETNSFEKDKKLTITSARLNPADKFQSGQGIDKSIDGNLSSLYHSPWSGMSDIPTITLEYDVDPNDADIMNYLVLYPRPSGANGIIKTATVWVKTESKTNWDQVATIESANSNSPIVVDFETPVIEPRSIKIEITDAYSHDVGKYYVSLAEIECYESKSISSLDNDRQFFTDNTFSELIPGIGINDISKIENPFIQNIAAYLLADKYPKEFRVQEYDPYRPVSDLAKELKTSGYCQFENPTGIYFKENEDIVVFVDDAASDNIMLRIKDFGSSLQDNTYKLRTGVNVITTKGKGNGYISYFTTNWENIPKVKIHIASGKVNGYFDTNRHSNEDGAQMLNNAVSEILDIKGKYVNLAYSVNSLKSNAYNDLKSLIVVYDSIVSSQYSIMGLKKHNRLPKNHMFGRVIWDGYMHADGTGAAFHENTMVNLANPERLKDNIWGPAHEFGHVNQVRPGMKWVGTSECTNNIYSAWIQYCYTPQNLRLEHENIGGTVGGRFNAFLNNALIKNQEWGLQAGPDRVYGVKPNGKWGGDHFVKLVPLWQLHLYYHVAGEGNSWHKPYFWADIFEKVRNTNEAGMSHGQLQINFVKNTCDAVQQDLSDFFTKIGMLQVVDKYFDDYSSAQKTITQTMIDDAISYCSKYPKPEIDYIHYISGNSIEAYKNKQPITGQFNNGVSGDTTKKILHNNWQNVVVFETYAEDKLIQLTMVGTGSNTNSFTNVPYPDGSSRIEAVAYNGKRTLVFGNR